MSERRSSFSYPPKVEVTKVAPRPRSSTFGGSAPNQIGSEKHILICLDTSSSMYEGNKLKDSLSLISRLVTHKHFKDQLDVMYFNSTVYKKMWNVDTSTNLNETQGGGTKIEVALSAAIERLESSSNRLLLFLLFSDGLDTISKQEQLLQKYKSLANKTGVILISFFVLIEESSETDTVTFLRKLLRDGFCEISNGEYSNAIQEILKTYQDINQPITRQRMAGVSSAMSEISSLAKEVQTKGEAVIRVVNALFVMN